MPTQPSAFDAEYSPDLIELAAYTFRDYQFKRYGPWLISACIVNAVGLALSLWLGVTGALLAWVVFIVVIGPVWLLYKYFIAPSQYASKLKRNLPSHVPISVGSEAVSFVVRGQEATIPWSIVKAVVETQALFLLVLSPIASTFVPKSGLPIEAYDMLHSRSRSGAA
jgi:hypothetical protein